MIFASNVSVRPFSTLTVTNAHPSLKRILGFCICLASPVLRHGSSAPHDLQDNSCRPLGCSRQCCHDLRTGRNSVLFVSDSVCILLCEVPLTMAIARSVIFSANLVLAIMLVAAPVSRPVVVERYRKIDSNTGWFERNCGTVSTARSVHHLGAN